MKIVTIKTKAKYLALVKDRVSELKIVDFIYFHFTSHFHFHFHFHLFFLFLDLELEVSIISYILHRRI